MSENFTAVFMFLVIGYLTTYFTENMIIVFAVSIFATNFAVAMNYNRNREGMSSKEKDKKDDDEKKEDNEEEKIKKTIDDNTITATSRGNKFDNLDVSPSTGKKDKSKNTTTVNAMKEALTQDNKNPKNPVIIDKKKEKGEVEGTCSGPSCKASKTAQIENAHAIVENLISDPKAMKEQQKAIEDTIKNLEPMIDKVEGMMNKLGGSKIMDLIGGLGPMLGNK